MLTSPGWRIAGHPTLIDANPMTHRGPAHRFPFVAIVALLVAVPLLASCSRRPLEPPPPPDPTVISLTGTADMNAGGNAAIIRVYMLSSDAAFRRTPIQDFWQDDSAALGADLVGTKREVLLYPGERESMQFVPGADVAFIGFAADLRDPDPNAWRVIRPVDELRGRRVAVTVNSDRVTVDASGE
jgi:type VI secretion system VasD/TssJ family lipoprotein